MLSLGNHLLSPRDESLSCRTTGGILSYHEDLCSLALFLQPLSQQFSQLAG